MEADGEQFVLCQIELTSHLRLLTCGHKSKVASNKSQLKMAQYCGFGLFFVQT